jgi:pyrrolysine biosynthesis protein PylC
MLEIDARFPSQTPMAVYHSTGINLVEELARITLSDPDSALAPGGSAPAPDGSVTAPISSVRGTILEHVRVRQDHLSVEGEGMMAEAGPLHLAEGFFGAEEALTNHEEGKDDWVATLVVTGEDLPAARERRDRVLEEMGARCGVRSFSDEGPDERFGQRR